MKTFTIGLPNKHVDNKGTFKTNILKAIAEQFPFFKWNQNEDEKDFNLRYVGPSDRLIFDFTDNKPKFYAFNKRFWNPFKTYKTNTDNTEHYTPYDLTIAMHKLRKYAAQYNDYLKDPGYDYLTEEGLPVRIYQNFIQIGDHIIPFKNHGFYSFSPKKKEDTKIVNIIMNIYNNIEINEAA